MNCNNEDKYNKKNESEIQMYEAEVMEDKLCEAEVDRDDYYTAEEVAQLTGKKKNTILKRCREGKYNGAIKIESRDIPAGIWLIPKDIINNVGAESQIIVFDRKISKDEFQTILNSIMKNSLHDSVVKPLEDKLIDMEKTLANNEKILNESIKSTIEPLEKKIQELENLLDCHYKNIDTKLRNATQEKEEPKGFWARLFGK